MQLYRAFDAPRYPATQVFRESRLTATGFALLMLLVTLGLLWVALERDASPVVWASVGVCALMFLRAAAAARASLRPSSWLLRYSPDGLLIQFRSYLDTHLPADLETIVYIALTEIEAASKTLERRTVPDRRGRGATTQRWTWVELQLRHSRTEQLREALARERAASRPRAARTRARPEHRPVELPEPARLRILWRGQNSHVRPGAARLLALLAERVRIDPERRVEVDLRAQQPPSPAAKASSSS